MYGQNYKNHKSLVERRIIRFLKVVLAQEVESVVGKSDEETTMKIIENNRIFAFDGKNAHDPILSELILALHTPVNILFANTKEVDGMAVGQMVIELPENMEDILRVTQFMKERGIPFEEVHA